MQEESDSRPTPSSAPSSGRRSNKARTEATRRALIAAARALFVEKGYAETGTPEIVAAAKVTRGALYHHFADKADLFRATVWQEAEAVAAQIGRETANPSSGLDALQMGAEAYFTAMSVPGRSRLLLLDGPSVLGHAEMGQIDKKTGGEELRKGLMFALSAKDGGRTDADKSDTGKLPIDALSELLSAAFDRAALSIIEGRAPDDYKAASRLILRALCSMKK